MILTLFKTVRDLPDMSARIGEAGGADAPRPVHRAVQQLYAAFAQLLADGIYIFHADGELEARPGFASRDNLRRDQLVSRRLHKQVDQHVVEFEDRGIRIFEVDRQAKHFLIERFRLLQIFNEQRDDADIQIIPQVKITLRFFENLTAIL